MPHLDYMHGLLQNHFTLPGMWCHLHQHPFYCNYLIHDDNVMQSCTFIFSNIKYKNRFVPSLSDWLGGSWKNCSHQTSPSCIARIPVWLWSHHCSHQRWWDQLPQRSHWTSQLSGQDSWHLYLQCSWPGWDTTGVGQHWPSISYCWTCSTRYRPQVSCLPWKSERSWLPHLITSNTTYSIYTEHTIYQCKCPSLGKVWRWCITWRDWWDHCGYHHCSIAPCCHCANCYADCEVDEE